VLAPSLLHVFNLTHQVRPLLIVLGGAELLAENGKQINANSIIQSAGKLNPILF